MGKDSDELLLEIYRRLLDAYGPQGWWPASSRFEMIAGAILTQAAAWRNVERALGNLLSSGIEDWPAVHALPQDDLAELVRPVRILQRQGAQAESLCRARLRGI